MLSQSKRFNKESSPKPGTRPPPTPPAERSQAEVLRALLPSSPPAPLWAFLALYPEPEAEGSGCASISSAHDPSAAACKRPCSSTGCRWGMRTLIRQEVAQGHLLHLLLGSCRMLVSLSRTMRHARGTMCCPMCPPTLPATAVP